MPYSFGGLETMDNLRPACRACNTQRSNRLIQGHGVDIRVVMGPPAAGKSRYVRDQATPADTIVDLDVIARALMPREPERSHTYPEHIRDIAIAARQGAIERAMRHTSRSTTWIIHAIPSPTKLALYQLLRYPLITIDPGRAIVEERARTMRPSAQSVQIARWYASGLALAKPTDQSGAGPTPVYWSVTPAQPAPTVKSSGVRPW
ncbi:hypothetical protein HQQ81_05675 [Microbacteriaceae bacterium VKM Ac-2854]|nr:hypothetical protein [Microbacteriaceae bacterium VKM Ac-2854]